MEFALPSTLAERLAPYDPTIQEQAAAERARLQAEAAANAIRSKVATAPRTRRFGMPVGILPNTVVKPEALQRVLEYINKAPAEHRHEHWLTPDGQFLAAVWLICSKQSGDFWFAAWANPARNALHLRVMAKASQGKSPHLSWKRKPEASGSTGYRHAEHLLRDAYDVPMGGTAWHMRDFRFSEAAALASPFVLSPEQVIAYGTRYSRSACVNDTFRAATYDRVLRYLNSTLSRPLPERDVKTSRYGSLPDIFFGTQTRPIDHLEYQQRKAIAGSHPDPDATYGEIRASWRPDLAWIALPERARTPWFRSYFQDRINLAMAHWSAFQYDDYKNALQSLLQAKRELEAILWLWPDASLDHLQSLLFCSMTHWQKTGPNCLYVYGPSHTRFQEAINPQSQPGWNAPLIPSHSRTQDAILGWLRNHVPIASWSRWIADKESSQFELLGQNLKRLVTAKPDALLSLPRPKRWRFSSVQEVIAEQLFRATTPDEALPQDLFPQPAPVITDAGKFTFFQPRSTHQLAAWGQAVRNCVGNDSYASRVKHLHAFIVLALLDNKPTFTAQLSLRDGRLHVDQLVGIANQHLSLEEKEPYQAAMAQALTQLA